MALEMYQALKLLAKAKERLEASDDALAVEIAQALKDAGVTITKHDDRCDCGECWEANTTPVDDSRAFRS